MIEIIKLVLFLIGIFLLIISFYNACKTLYTKDKLEAFKNKILQHAKKITCVFLFITIFYLLFINIFIILHVYPAVQHEIVSTLHIFHLPIDSFVIVIIQSTFLLILLFGNGFFVWFVSFFSVGFLIESRWANEE